MSPEHVYHYGDNIIMHHYNVKWCAKVVPECEESALLTKAAPQLYIHIHEPYTQSRKILST